MPFTRGAGLGFAQAAGAAAETLEQRLRILTGQFQHAAVGVAGRVGRHGGHRRRAPAWASGGNGARYVALGRRMRRMTSGTSTSECSGCLFCPAQRPGKNPGNGATAKGRGAGLSGRHGRQAACLARACAAAASGRRPSIRRVRACSSTGAMLPVSGSRQKRAGRENGKEASGRIGAGGSGGRWVSQAGDSVLRVPYGPGCVWPVGSQEWTGQTGMPAPRAGAIEARGLRH